MNLVIFYGSNLFIMKFRCIVVISLKLNYYFSRDEKEESVSGTAVKYAENEECCIYNR